MDASRTLMGYVRNRDGVSVGVSIESMPMMGTINANDSYHQCQ
ncbi:hypothetical protein [Bacteroides stercorirosoris]|nr:hypothetical protein [Bacteroides stercorirosoris]